MDDLTFDVDLVLRPGNNNFHTANPPNEEFRRVLVRTPNERSPLTTRIKIQEVHHGKMIHEEEKHYATLLVFDIRFQSQLQEHRYKSAKVTFEFFNKRGDSQKDPEVVLVAPDKMHWLNKTSYDKTTQYGASAGSNIGNDMLGGNANIYWGVEESKPVDFKATVTGSQGYSSGKRGLENSVTWTMQENKDKNEGIPAFLQTAILLKRPNAEAFFAKLRVESKVSSAFGSLSFVTDKDKVIDDVTFTPSRVQVRNFSATGIKQDDLEHMERLPMKEYFQVNLSEEDPLTHSAATSTSAPHGLQVLPPSTMEGEDRDRESLPQVPLPGPQSSIPLASTTSPPPIHSDVVLCRPADVALSAAKAAEAAARAALGAAKAAEESARAARMVAEASIALLGSKTA